MEKLIDKVKVVLKLGFWNVLAIVLVLAAFWMFPEFSYFCLGLLKFIVVVTLWIVIDKTILKEFDTIQEIKNGNIAVALTLIALAILFYGAMGNV